MFLKCLFLASTIRNRATLSCAYVMWWRINYIPMQNSLWNVHTYLYCRKVKCHWNSFLSFSFCTCYDLLFCCRPCVSPSCCLFQFSVFFFTSIGYLVEMLKIGAHSRLKMLGMYGVTWFPLKSYIRTKSKWVKNKKREDTNQTKRLKSKKHVFVHPDIEVEKRSRHLGLGYKACYTFFSCIHFIFMSF